ncbi:hypothetical protein [Candidatus Flexifilum breve]|uniref:hypothetical protein n=1 Tax=Candidatus Flexifilum breve TaxID=3140694 RepID=UPI003312FCBA
MGTANTHGSAARSTTRRAKPSTRSGACSACPSPGGPNIERVALQGSATAFDFPRAKTDSSYDFSFSGLKTAVKREATVASTRQGR